MAFYKQTQRVCLLAATLIGTSSLAPSLAQAATFVVINADSAGVGFNDPTMVAPVGGNPGTTIGAQRLNAFQFAANIWGALVASNVTIQVSASFAPLTCSSTSAILGSAGPFTFLRDFTGAPVASTWYAIALANALNGSDLDPTNPDITAQFNGAIGTTCAFPSTWYYGFDGNASAGQIDFITVLVHELGHGLGFLTLVNLTTGAKALGSNDTFMLNLENHGAMPPDYPSMTDAQRLAASTATGNLHWVGANVQNWSGLLSAGTVGTHVQMFAPNPQQAGSSVSHWDTALTPNQVMEPSYTQVLHRPIMELPLFRDIGWKVLIPKHDFNSDVKSDIAWRDTSGNVAIWEMNGTTILNQATSFVGNVAGNWSILGNGDYNGDGKNDIAWHDSTGNVAIWEMNGTTILNQATSFVANVPGTWTIVGTGDFNGDGRSDILWRDGSGNVAIWEMNGTTVLNQATSFVGNVAGNWSVFGNGDYNGDGKSDILWRDGSGNVAIWEMNGTTVLNQATSFVGNVGGTWSIVGTGDFNGDGKSDILWHDGSGNVAIWEMNGTTILNQATSFVANVPGTWSIFGSGDYNGDGKSDIVWRDGSGNVAIWEMNGTSVLNQATSFVGNVAGNWLIQDPQGN
jgi:predicted small secreted protein